MRKTSGAVMLRPGEMQVARVTLEYPFDAGRPPRGDYEAHVVYYAKFKELVPGAAEELVSNRVWFRVRDGE